MEIGSHLSHNSLLGIFPTPFLFPLPVREVSALRAVKICPALPKVATKLSRFPQDTFRLPKFLSISGIRAQDLSHCIAISTRNALSDTRVLQHGGSRDAPRLAGRTIHRLPILLRSV